MANGTLTEEVRKRKTAEALIGPDDDIDPDDSADEQDNVPSGATDTQQAEAAPDDSLETDQTQPEPEPVRALKGKVQTFNDYGGTSSLTLEEQRKRSASSANLPPSAASTSDLAGGGGANLFQNPATGSYEPLIQQRLYDVPQEEGGGQYVIDQDTGQQIPRAQAATAEDLAAQPPTQGAIALPQVNVQAPGEPAPDTLTQVERAQLVKPPAAAPPQLTQVERGQLVKVPPGTAPRAIAVQTFDDYGAPGDIAPRALSPGAAPAVQPAGSVNLASVRQPFLAELQDPQTTRLLMASTQAEVGGQGSSAQQAYIESVMNRAAAEGRTLQSVLTDTHYYPSATINQLDASIGGRAARNYQSIINSVLNGSNISNLATGNESGDVHSGGAPVTFASGGERFVRENWTHDWINTVGAGEAAQAKPQREVQSFDDYAPQQPQAPAMRTITPQEQTVAQARVAAQIQQQQNIVSKLPEADSGNIIGLYKRLGQSVDGVSLPMRQAMQANLKPQIITLMQQKFPGLSAADAWTKATSDVNALDVGREWIFKALGYGQQFTNVMQKGVAGSDQLHVNQFLESVLPGTSDQEKHAFLVQLYQMDPAQRAQIIQAYLPQQQAGMPSTDPQQIVSALDRLSDPNFQKQQATDLDNARKEMLRNVSDDPRLAGTGLEKVINATAQMPAFIAAFSNPLLMPVAMAQVSDQVHDQLKAEHPDWDEKTLQDNTARATLVQFYGMEAATRIMTAGGAALLRGVESPAKRAIAQAVLGAGGVTGAGVLTQAGTNIVTGQPIGKGLGEAALTSLIQGGAAGLAHGAGEFGRRAEVPVERTEAPPLPPVTQQRPYVTAEQVLGPEVPPETLPWYKGGPIITRAQERTAFAPGELRARIADLQNRGYSPEQLQQAIAALRPESDFTRQNVFLGSSPADQILSDQAKDMPSPTPASPTAPVPAAVDPARVTKRAASDEVHWVPTAQVEQRWNTPGKGAVYIPPGGTENTIGTRYPDAIKHVQSDAPTNALEATVRPDGTIDFTDGRHRFAAMRDLGIAQVPLALDEDSVNNARANGIIDGGIQKPSPAKVSEAEPISSAIANRYVRQRMAAGELGQIDPSEGQSTEDMMREGLQMSRPQREGLIDNFMKAEGGDLEEQGAAIRSKEMLLSEQARAASRMADDDPTNPQLQAQAKAAADAVTAFHNGPVKKFKRVWSDSGRILQREIPLDYTTFNGMKEAYLKGNNKEAPAALEPKLKQMVKEVSKTADAERGAINNLGKEIEKKTRGKVLPADDQIRARLMEIMKDLPCPT